MKQKPEPINVKYEDLEQYDFTDDEIIQEKIQRYALAIGAFLIVFSGLEHALDIEIANLIHGRGHDKGYIIIKNLDFSDKINLLYDLNYPIIVNSTRRKAWKMKQLVSIRKKLIDFSFLRNKIAHAKWNTLDKEGYVRTDIKISKESGFIRFKKLKITLPEMRKGMKEMEALAEKLPTLSLNIFDFS